MKKDTIKWVIYARKSTESSDRQIQSIDDQIKIQKDIALREGLHIVDTIFESKSAKAPYVREEFQRLTAMINDGKVDGILTWKMDRLFRNPIDGGFIQYALQQKKLLCIKTPEKEYLPEDNAIILSVESGMSSQYIRDLSVNVKRGMKSKAEKGWFPNIPPIGYLNSKLRDKGNETILVDESNFPIVRKMWDLMLTGNYTVPKVLKIANNEWGLRTPSRKKLGGKPLSESYAYLIFSNIFYTGNFIHSGIFYQGKHTPMITMEEFDKVQIIMGKRGRPRPKKLEFPYTGIMHCSECGAQITATQKHKLIKSTGDINTYVYYHCTKRKINVKCDAKAMKVEELEKEVSFILGEYTIDQRFYNQALEILKRNHKDEIEVNETIYHTHLANKEETQRKINNALQFLLNGTIEESQYKETKKTLELELQKHDIKAKETENKVKNLNEVTENAFTFLRLAKSEFENKKSELMTKKSIVSSLGLNHRIDNGKLFIDLHSWLHVIKNGEKILLPQIEALELDETLTGERRKEAFASFHTGLCAE